MTKDELKNQFYDGRIVNAALMGVLIDNLKGVQSPVSSPASSGNAVAFIDSISQDAEGNITVTKKNVNFSGFVPVIQLRSYQSNDIQVVEDLGNDGTGNEFDKEIEHRKGHYPTVRLLDKNTGAELRPTARVPEPYMVKHIDRDSLVVVLSGDANDGTTYQYVLD